MKKLIIFGAFIVGLLILYGDELVFSKRDRLLCTLYDDDILPVGKWDQLRVEPKGFWSSDKFRQCLFSESIQADYKRKYQAERDLAEKKALEEKITEIRLQLPSLDAKLMAHVEKIGTEKFESASDLAVLFLQELPNNLDDDNISWFISRNPLIKISFSACRFQKIKADAWDPNPSEFFCEDGGKRYSLQGDRFRYLDSEFGETIRRFKNVTLFIESRRGEYINREIEFHVLGVKLTAEDIEME